MIFYLENRKQFVSFDYGQSDVLTIESGIPQESMLGPVLFLVDINDFPTYIDEESFD